MEVALPKFHEIPPTGHLQVRAGNKSYREYSVCITTIAVALISLMNSTVPETFPDLRLNTV